jgi:hypothetical protein
MRETEIARLVTTTGNPQLSPTSTGNARLAPEFPYGVYRGGYGQDAQHFTKRESEQHAAKIGALHAGALNKARVCWFVRLQ